MTITCYRCPRRLAWAGDHTERRTIARAFGWIIKGEHPRIRFWCPACRVEIARRRRLRA